MLLCFQEGPRMLQLLTTGGRRTRKCFAFSGTRSSLPWLFGGYPSFTGRVRPCPSHSSTGSRELFRSLLNSRCFLRWRHQMQHRTVHNKIAAISTRTPRAAQKRASPVSPSRNASHKSSIASMWSLAVALHQHDHILQRVFWPGSLGAARRTGPSDKVRGLKELGKRSLLCIVLSVVTLRNVAADGRD